MAYSEERRSIAGRIRFIHGAMVAVAVLYLLVLWYLQIVKSGEFREKSETQARKITPILAPRGFMYDRNGRLLARNRPGFALRIDREAVESEQATAETLSRILGLPAAEVWSRWRKSAAGKPGYEPLIVAEDLDFPRVAWVEARQIEHPELRVDLEFVRDYPFDSEGSHLLGYVGEISEKELAGPRYSPYHVRGDLVGKSGLEQVYDEALTGINGERVAVVNNLGREIESRIERDPEPGASLYLTIDLDVQRAAEEGLRGKSGAVIAMDPRNGEILALASSPGYDPNLFATRISTDAWRSLLDDPGDPLQNRAVQSAFPPGSTFKLLIALAALEEGLIRPNTTYHCSGQTVVAGQLRHCWKEEGHGTVALQQAIVHSCNVYFYHVGQMLGIRRIHKYADALGYGRVTGIDLPREVAGTLPSEEWKKARFRDRWYEGETVSVAIGQGYLSVTPLQQLCFYSAITNGGTLVTPHCARSIRDGLHPERNRDFTPRPRGKVDVSPSTLRTLREALWSVVNSYGTGGRAKVEGKDVCGKTGTTQLVREIQRKKLADIREHAWFIGFAPRDNARIAYAIFVEHGGHGGDTAAPIARLLVEAYYRAREGKPAPEEPLVTEAAGSGPGRALRAAARPGGAAPETR